MDRLVSVTSKDDDANSLSRRNVEEEEAGVIAAPASSNQEEALDDEPAQIPPESKTDDDNDGNEEEEDDGTEYSYESEDEADAAALTGFIRGVGEAVTAVDDTTASAAPATIEEDTTEKKFSPSSQRAIDTDAPNKKWRQPSREAVNMSLRAEQETTGNKRRLAQDLYRIMARDTNDAGFSLKPASEDCMKKWIIKLFQFDPDSNLAKDMKVLGLGHIELEMSFPDQYPFEPPFVRVVRPRFKRQTGFVMNGALCMELLTKDGWNPVNDIESVIVSIRSLLVVGDGRLEAAYNLSEEKYNSFLQSANEAADKKQAASATGNLKCDDDDEEEVEESLQKRAKLEEKESVNENQRRVLRGQIGAYTTSEAEAAYTHLSDYHKKKGWDSSGWWSRKG